MNDENVIDKTYDSSLMKRLLKYAIPYWKLLTLSIVLLVIITGLELLNPYLIKVTIDDYINGYRKPMIEMELDSPLTGIEFNGNKYVKQSLLTDNELEIYKDYPVVNILKENSSYYIVEYNSDNSLAGIQLDKDTYKDFRAADIKGIDRIALLFFLMIFFTFIFSYLQAYILNYTSQK